MQEPVDLQLKPELVETPDGLALACGDQLLLPNFNAKRLSQKNLSHELLVKAAKLKHAGEEPLAIDATAGLGDDSLLLAAAGFSVKLYERDSTIAALLRDALARAAAEAQLAPVVARMQLVEANSIEALRALATSDEEPPALVYLDPMFPARSKSAAVKKKLQLLQLLEQPAQDEAELLEAALSAKPRKVVVKRPAKGPQLAGAKPSYSVAGKAVRYDVYLPHS